MKNLVVYMVAFLFVSFHVNSYASEKSIEALRLISIAEKMRVGLYDEAMACLEETYTTATTAGVACQRFSMAKLIRSGHLVKKASAKFRTLPDRDEEIAGLLIKASNEVIEIFVVLDDIQAVTGVDLTKEYCKVNSC